MKCENLQFNLPFYAEDVLTGAEREDLDAHLERCPVCRAKLAGLQNLRNDLRGLARPAVPADLLFSVKMAVAVELKKSERETVQAFSSGFSAWRQRWLMPYGVGTLASFLITFALLTTLLSTKKAAEKGVELARADSNRVTALTIADKNSRNEELVLGDNDYAFANLPVGVQTPSINPAGALVALTKSIVRGKMKDEEVVVVADVFGDGIAKIAEIVQPPHDARAMVNLEKALNEDRAEAPFVPATQDRRADVVRVILKIQRVDVIEKSSSAKPKSRNR